MNKSIAIIAALIAFSTNLFAGTFTGKVLEEGTNEALIGATVSLKNTTFYAFAGLNGDFKIKDVPPGTYTVVVTYLSYSTITQTLKIGSAEVNKTFFMQSEATSLGDVRVVAIRRGETEAGARTEERKADNVINIISAKAIEISPDITVANVVQRVSGLTVERNSNGDGQYAIVRGMDKRYNYTLVNGIKIPSPDNENRYVPLDIFPSDLLSRLVVSKSLTPDMEGDAVGGVVDMKLKEAPNSRVFKVSLGTGYNEAFINTRYNKFDRKTIWRTPPREQLGKIITAEELDYDHFDLERVQALPNLFASAVLGNRFMDNRLGVIVAGSYQNSYRSSERTEFGVSENNRGQEIPQISQMQDRIYSIQQNRSGVFNKIDFRQNNRNHFFLTTAYMRMQNNESRLVEIDELRGVINPTLEYNSRNQVNIQQVLNTTLQGKHEIFKPLNVDWSLVYSYAQQDMPDNSMIRLVKNYDTGEPRWIMGENFTRIWEANSDQDISAYYNMTYNTAIADQSIELKYGGLQRIKNRQNSYDLYSFKPRPGIQEYDVFNSSLADITWRTTGGSGTSTHVLNYESYENIFANYMQFKFTRWNTNFIGGVRAEHTQQGFVTQDLNYPEGEQVYWSFLPSLHVKYSPNTQTNWRGSYYRSISRPSFLEIIPYRRPFSEEIFARAGNPNIKHAEAHSLDARYEFFPKPTEQLLVGAFYKYINNPIEYAVIPGNTELNEQNRAALMPVNFESASNYGVEMDYTKFFNQFGIKANYTFTLSTIESMKRTWGRVTAENINQVSDLQKETDDIAIGDSTFISVPQLRPLQGQSMHLGNISLLYKNQKMGLDAQLSMVYTGERIAIVSVGLDNDIWQKAFTQLDFSIDKTWGKADQFTLFCKINNILNSPFEMYIKKQHQEDFRINEEIQPNGNTETRMRYDLYNRNYMLGIRYSLK